MKKLIPILVVLFCTPFLTTGGLVNAQSAYSDYDELTDRLQNLSSHYSEFTDLETLATSPGGRELWVLTIGTGDVKTKPAVAVVGGAEGSHVLGSELSLKFAEQLLEDSSEDSIRTLLNSTTFYVFPRINPDATEQYFADLQYERNGNEKATDDDRDGEVNEDPYEDLNDDGLITMIRVRDKAGKWIPYSRDERVMVKAEAKKGEQGSYHLYSEGVDNDNDGHFNEDSEGGVDLNKNFSFDYPNFEPGAGEYMVSEDENRALLDFLFEEAWNVYAVVSFGPPNNLSNPISFSRSGVSKRVITGWYKKDTAVNDLVSDTYNNITGLEDAPDASGEPGDFFQWAYFHYGRFSFSTPGWWTPKVDQNSDESTEREGPGPGDNADARFLAWAESRGIDAFVEWQETEHPDFPDRQVEVGGIKPFLQITPPYEDVDSLSRSHTEFLIELANMKPSVELINFSTERTGDRLTRINVEIYNSGALPTASRLGERTRWVRDVKVDFKVSDNVSLVSGEKLQLFDSLDSDESISLSWLVRGTGSITIEAGAPQTGFKTIEQTIN